MFRLVSAHGPRAGVRADAPGDDAFRVDADQRFGVADRLGAAAHFERARPPGVDG